MGYFVAVYGTGVVFILYSTGTNQPVFLIGEMSNNEFELTFLATVSGLGLETYFLRQLRPEEEVTNLYSVIYI
jgi:hypothetical protein